MRGQLRIEQKPQISGRQAGSYDWRILLHIIRYQPVVFGIAEFPEIPPRAEPRQAEKTFVLGGQLWFPVRGPAIDPIREEIREQPEYQYGRSNIQRGGTNHGKKQAVAKERQGVSAR